MISRFYVFYSLIFCFLTFNGYSQTPPPFTLGNDTTICEGDFIFYVLPNDNGETYLWEDSTTGPYHLITTEGLYHVMTTHNEDEHADSVYVTIQPQHSFDLGEDTVVLYKSAYILCRRYQRNECRSDYMEYRSRHGWNMDRPAWMVLGGYCCRLLYCKR